MSPLEKFYTWLVVNYPSAFVFATILGVGVVFLLIFAYA